MAPLTFDGREERERNPGLSLEWVQRGVGNATDYTQLPMQLSSTPRCEHSWRM